MEKSIGGLHRISIYDLDGNPLKEFKAAYYIIQKGNEFFIQDEKQMFSFKIECTIFSEGIFKPSGGTIRNISSRHSLVVSYGRKKYLAFISQLS